MTAHLLVVAIGPVQDFIAAARRTRDLWFGSYVLSEISKAAARAVRDQGATLIFPAPGDARALDAPSGFNVANIIFAALENQDPRQTADRAKDAAEARWQAIANQVRQRHERYICDDIWQQQVGDILECYAAWVVRGVYQDDRAKLMRLLAGRKNCKDFAPAQGRAGVFKSSLDGLRESVLRDNGAARNGLRLAAGEQLDVVGVVKRKGEEGAPPYPSVARVAADPWVRGLSADQLSRLRQACEPIAEVHRLSAVYGDFPFEGAVVYPSRHCDLAGEGAATDEQLGALKQALTKLGGEPSPYLAVLVADGDDMGKKLATLTSVEEHQAFSTTLAGFAAGARGVVESKDGPHAHRGVLVYAGGDDVLAFVPVDRALACAHALHAAFVEATGMNLSVGVAIAHFMEPLEDLLAYGRAAEKDAKGVTNKNALAVHLHKRGGGPVKVRGSWSNNLDQHLGDLARLINDRAISGRVAYDLVKLAEVYQDWPTATVKDACQRDVRRVLSAKRPGGPVDRTDDIRALVDRHVSDAASLKQLADELLVARQLAAAGRKEVDG